MVVPGLLVALSLGDLGLHDWEGSVGVVEAAAGVSMSGDRGVVVEEGNTVGGDLMGALAT